MPRPRVAIEITLKIEAQVEEARSIEDIATGISEHAWGGRLRERRGIEPRVTVLIPCRILHVRLYLIRGLIVTGRIQRIAVSANRQRCSRHQSEDPVQTEFVSGRSAFKQPSEKYGVGPRRGRYLLHLKCANRSQVESGEAQQIAA